MSEYSIHDVSPNDINRLIAEHFMGWTYHDTDVINSMEWPEYRDKDGNLVCVAKLFVPSDDWEKLRIVINKLIKEHNWDFTITWDSDKSHFCCEIGLDGNSTSSCHTDLSIAVCQAILQFLIGNE